MGEYIGNPVNVNKWDTVKLDKTAGHYMICDKHGVDMKWIDRKDGMMIKIRAKRAHWSGYEYLQSDYLGKYSKYDANHKLYG